MFILRIVILITLTASSIGYSQPIPKPPKGELASKSRQAGGESIPVQAVVTDRNGQPVEGLSQEDFRLEEDGVPQTPTHFSMEKSLPKAEIQPAGPKDAAPGLPRNSQRNNSPSSPRVLVFLIDTVHISSNGLENVRLAITRFLEQRKEEPDLVAIMTTSGKPGGKSEFTTEFGKLQEDLKKVRPGRTQFESFLTPALCGKVVRRDPESLSLANLIINSEDRTSGSMLIPKTGNAEAEAVGKCMMLLLEAASRRKIVMNSIETAIQKMSALPGQHLIALFSEGFSIVASGGETSVADIYPVTGSAVRAGAVIYAFDAKVSMASKQVNIESYSLASEIQNTARDSQHGMALLASETGGDAFLNLDGLSGQLQHMLSENSMYYRLAYLSPSGKDPKKYRSIKVSVRDHPEYQVRAPKGYVMTVSN